MPATREAASKLLRDRQSRHDRFQRVFVHIRDTLRRLAAQAVNVPELGRIRMRVE
jgi:hypothetical protein